LLNFFLNIFYEVDVEDVPDYVEVIHTPIDYGTIHERIEGGNYVDLIASDDISRDDENSTMEEILLHVLCDIERVHFNCQVRSLFEQAFAFTTVSRGPVPYFYYLVFLAALQQRRLFNISDWRYPHA
jgi:hypothetical protein